MPADPIDPVAAFNAAHPPRPPVPAEPIRFAGPSPEEVALVERVKALRPRGVEPFRGVRSTRTGHNRTWKGEIRNPR